MFKIDRNAPWPPDIDFAAIRSTLKALEHDMRRVPKFADIADALADTLAALDKAEAKCPTKLSDRVYTTSRFKVDPRDD